MAALRKLQGIFSNLELRKLFVQIVLNHYVYRFKFSFLKREPCFTTNVFCLKKRELQLIKGCSVFPFHSLIEGRGDRKTHI